MSRERVLHGTRPVVGFGEELSSAPAMVVASPPSPWTVALATTVLSAATGWVIEEVVSSVRGRRRR